MPKHSSWPPTQTRRTPSPARRPDYADDEFDDYDDDDDDGDDDDDCVGNELKCPAWLV